MNKYYYITIFCILQLGNLNAQTFLFAELTGSPNLNTTGWNLTGNAFVGNTNGTVNNFNDELILTNPNNFESGGVFWDQPINLNQCNQWIVEFDFRIFDGSIADGLAFCFLDIPPTGFVSGAGIGIPGGSNGLKVVIDTWDNCNGPKPELQIYSGFGYDECINGIISSSNTNGQYNFIRSNEYRSAKITYDNGNVDFYINNTLYLSAFAPANFTGYMGFTSSTGGETDRHSIKNVKIYTNQAVSDAGPNQTICSGQSVEIGSPNNSDYSYSWSPANGLNNSEISNPTLTLENNSNISDTITYVVETSFVNQPGVCPSYDSVMVVVHPFPEIDVSIPPDICEGDSLTLTVSNSGGANISWSNGVIDNTPFVPSVGATTYSVTVELEGCESSEDFTINVLSSENFEIISFSDPTACNINNGTIVIGTLVPNQAYQVSYNNLSATTIQSDSDGLIKIEGLASGTYSDFVVSAGDCSSNSDESVELINPDEPIINVGQNQTICDGEEITLSASNPTNANLSWSNGVINGQSFVPPVGNNNYILTAELNGCISIDSVEIIVNPLPNIDAGPDILVCEGESVTLVASGANNYNWNNNIQNNVSFIPEVGTTTFIVTAELNGCINSDEVTVTVEPFVRPEIEIISDVTCTFSEVEINVLSEVASTDCVWDFGDGTIKTGCNQMSHQYNSTGCFDITLEITNAAGCSAIEVFENAICITSAPIANFFIEPSTVTTLNPKVAFINQSVGATDYLWDFGDFSPFSNENSPSHTYPSDVGENYIVTLVAYDENECSDTATAIVEVREELIFWVPNSFTPDEDKYNPVFQPVFVSGFDPMSYHFIIFNRWGEILFESMNHEVGWDGNYGGQKVQEGTYIWQISFKGKYSDEREIHNGHVTLLK